MKKFVCILMILVLSLSAALADCTCTVSPSIRLIAQQMTAMELNLTGEQMEILADVALDLHDQCRCEGFRSMILTALMEHTTQFTAAQILVMRAYMISCGCECANDNHAPVQPAKPATHTHKISTWVSENSTWHHAECSCGYVFEGERHQLGNVIRVEGNCEVRICKVCGYEVYVYASTGVCCGCHEGMCCENCGCGC